MKIPLRCIAHARSGDKGNTSNIAVFAYVPAFYPILEEQLTAARFKEFYRGMIKGKVTRYPAQNLHALNFVCEGALGGGVSRSLYLDNYGKALSSAVLGFEIDLPDDLLSHVDGERLRIADEALGRRQPAPPGGTMRRHSMHQTSMEEEVRRYCRPQPLVQGAEGSCRIGPFAFENGERLESMTVGFVTHGQLNARRDNAVLLLPGTTNTRHSADGYIGPGNAFDPERHFVIAFDAIGAGTSSKPSDGLGRDFPAYNIRDMVRAQHRVVGEYFGLVRLAGVAGASMGAFQALEWAIAHPAMMERLVLIVPAARAGNIFRSVVAAVQELLRLDPQWDSDRLTMTDSVALRAAVRLYFPWTVSDAYLERVPPALVEQEIESAIQRSAQWNGWDFVRRYQASASHDVGVPFQGDLARALAQVRARTLVMPTSTERLLGSDSGRHLANHIAGAMLVEVPTDRGHLGWRAVEGADESRLFASEISRFLNQETIR